MRRLARGCALAAALTVLAGPSAASAEDSSYVAASANGKHVFFLTEASLTAADTDDAVDLYERVGTSVRLVGVGPSATDGAPVAFKHTTPDGNQVFFQTTASLVPGDADGGGIDCYDRINGSSTVLLTGGLGLRPGAPDICPVAVSSDGLSLGYFTTEQFARQDVDGMTDVYVQRAGRIVLETPRTATPVEDPKFSDDLATVVFKSHDKLTFAHYPGGDSVFRSTAGATAGYEALAIGSGRIGLLGTSPDGSRVIFDTTDEMLPEDTDAVLDVYISQDGSLRLVDLGKSGYRRTAVVSRDTGRIAFVSRSQFDPLDDDGGFDAYRWEDGVYTLVGGEAAGEEGASVSILDASTDLGHIVLNTSGGLVPGDKDRRNDIYEWSAGAFQLVTKGPFAPPETRFRYLGLSDDGDRVLFESRSPFLGTDRDSDSDIYERIAGKLRLVTAPSPASPSLEARFSGLAAGDATFFQTRQGLVSSDRDEATDVYERLGKRLLLITPNSPPPARVFGAIDTPPGRNGKITYACRRCEGQPRGIYSIRPNGSGRRRLVDDRSASGPVISPDGDLIAFQAERQGHLAIFTVRPDGGGLTRVTKGRSEASDPAWLPGSRIAFYSDRDGDGDYYSVRPDGSDLRSIGERLYAASTDGGRLAVTDCPPGDDCDVDLVTPGGRKIRSLAASPDFETDPAFTPDGGTIAYVRSRQSADGTTTTNIWAVAVNGTRHRQLTPAAGPESTSPTFSPDGRLLLYKLGGELMTRDLSTGIVTELVPRGATSANWGLR